MIIDIPPFLTYIRSEFLYSDEFIGYFTPATIFGISILNNVLTFSSISEDGILYSNVPISALTNNKVSPKISEEECLYFFPNSIISAHRFEHLANIEDCGVWRKDNSYWQSGTYMFSFELLGEESPIHFIELSDGNYVLWPNPKITWGNIATDNLPMLCVEK